MMALGTAGLASAHGPPTAGPCPHASASALLSAVMLSAHFPGSWWRSSERVKWVCCAERRASPVCPPCVGYGSHRQRQPVSRRTCPELGWGEGLGILLFEAGMDHTFNAPRRTWV